MGKKYLVGILILFSAILLSPSNILAKSGLADALGKKRVYMPEITVDDKAEDYAYEKNLRDIILKKLSSRAFGIVNDRRDADIVITCRVLEYDFFKIDPVDHIYFPLAAVFDAFIKNNHVRIKTLVTVSTREGKVLWKEPVSGTITRKKIVPQEEYRIINERVADVFIRECFSEGGNRG